MTSFLLPGGVNEIGDFAFAASGLVTVAIASNVISIGNQAYFECANLTAITVDSLNPAYSSVSGVLFDKSTNTLIEYPLGKAATSYEIPRSVGTVGDYAFRGCTRLNDITIPNSVSHIGQQAFSRCTNLTLVGIGNSVARIDQAAFELCTSLVSVTIPNSVSSIGTDAFRACTSLRNVTVGYGTTNLEANAFLGCANLTGVYFQGSAPNADWTVFAGDDNATVYYLPRTTGWSDFRWNANIPTVLWNPSIQAATVQSGQFGFAITGTPDIPIAVAACTDPANPNWLTLQTCTLTNGSIYFSDPDWTNYPARVYRIRSP